MFKVFFRSLRPQTIAPYALLFVMLWNLAASPGTERGMVSMNEAAGQQLLSSRPTG